MNVEQSQTYRALNYAFELRQHDAREKLSVIAGKVAADWIETCRAGKGEEIHGKQLEFFLQKLQALAQKYKNANLRNVEGPTPEFLAKKSQNTPLLRLFGEGKIELRHLVASNEIARVVQAVTSIVSVRAKNLDAGLAGRGAWQNVSDEIAQVYSRRYKPWHADQKALTAQGLRNQALVLDVILWGESPSAVRKKHRIGWDRALNYLRDGLEDYAKLREIPID